MFLWGENGKTHKMCLVSCLVCFKCTINMRCKHLTCIFWLCHQPAPSKAVGWSWAWNLMWPDSELELEPYCRGGLKADKYFKLNKYSSVMKDRKAKVDLERALEVEIWAGKISGIWSKINRLQKNRKSSQVNLQYPRRNTIFWEETIFIWFLFSPKANI